MNQVWNACRTTFKLKTGLANPYRIAPRYCLLSDHRSSTEASFMERKKVNKDTYILRFALKDATKCLGLMIGQFVNIRLGDRSRPYNPISRIDEPGIVDFFVRDMREKNKAESFTHRLLDLKEGQNIMLEGPKTQYIYHGYGKMEWEGHPVKQFKHIGIVAYHSCVTAVYTLIDSIMPNYDNKVGVSLLWVGEQLDDFVFLEEFSMLSEQHRLNFNLMLKEPVGGWIGPFGKLNKNHIESYMPPPQDNTALILLGGEKEVGHIRPVLQEMGYKHLVFPFQPTC